MNNNRQKVKVLLIRSAARRRRRRRSILGAARVEEAKWRMAHTDESPTETAGSLCCLRLSSHSCVLHKKTTQRDNYLKAGCWRNRDKETATEEKRVRGRERKKKGEEPFPVHCLSLCKRHSKVEPSDTRKERKRNGQGRARTYVGGCRGQANWCCAQVIATLIRVSDWLLTKWLMVVVSEPSAKPLNGFRV